MENVTVYKRKSYLMIWGVVTSFFGGFVVYFIAAFLGGLVFESVKEIYLYIISGLVTLLLLCTTIFSENIKFEIDDNEFRYYQRGKLKRAFSLSKISVGYKTKTGSSTNTTIDLQVIDVETEEVTYIDCEPLGLNQFYKMFAVLELKTVKAPIAVTTIKK